MIGRDDKKAEDGGKKKSTSLDAMVRLFLQYYRIPTRKDIERLIERIDRMEKLLRSRIVETSRIRYRGRRAEAQPEPQGENPSASEHVLEILRAAGADGLSFSGIKEKTGFEDKKLRNIIFRLNRLGRIQRRSRGIYRLP
jgi:predicted Rossmann fold nucleotide-binding protein DprA/Smf involved in DNA uptake